MAKLQTERLVPDGMIFSSLYSDDLVFGRHSGNSAVFTEAPDDPNPKSDGDQFILSGQGFVYDGHSIIAGTVTSVKFVNSEGSVYATVSDFKVNMAHVKHDQSNGSLDIGDFLAKVTRGNDRILGSSGDDFLYGGSGNDTMTGAKGSDIFAVSGEGNVVITDFDAVGGGEHQDYLQLEIGGTFVKHGHDVIDELENGHTLTLLNVRYKDISFDDLVSI